MNSIDLFSAIRIEDQAVNESLKELRFLEGLLQGSNKQYTIKLINNKPVVYENYTPYNFLQTVFKIVNYIFCFPLIPFKLLYRWVNQDLFKKLPRLKVNPAQTDSQWLINEVKSHYTQDPTDVRSEDCLTFAIVNAHCTKRKDWDLTKLFSKRKITSKEVYQAQIAELVNLSAGDFFAIIDLISGDQAMQLLKLEKVSHERKMGLYFFNAHLARAYAYRQRSLFSAPIDIRTQEAAQAAFANMKKYTGYEMEELRFTNKFEYLDQIRIESSSTMKSERLVQNGLKKLNIHYLAQGIPVPVTSTFMTHINSVLRAVHTNPFYPPIDPTQYTGFRVSRMEVGNPDIFYMPGHEVENEMENMIEWLNNAIQECDNSLNNPIIVAAFAYQKIITVHPWIDGNGRTGRYVADLILRRYGLLPAAWDISEVNKAIFVLKDARETPDTAVKGMLTALERSYRIFT